MTHPIWATKDRDKFIKLCLLLFFILTLLLVPLAYSLYHCKGVVQTIFFVIEKVIAIETFSIISSFLFWEIKDVMSLILGNVKERIKDIKVKRQQKRELKITEKYVKIAEKQGFSTDEIQAVRKFFSQVFNPNIPS